MKDQTIAVAQKRYGLFILAVSIYLAGGLFFALWSYRAHRTTLLEYTDESLLRSATVLQKTFEMGTAISGFTDTDAYRAQLMPLASHGLSSTLNIIKVDKNRCTVLISVSDELDHFLEMVENSPPPAALQEILIAMADGGTNTSRMLTTENRPTGTLRYAILYIAEGPRKGTAYLVARDNHFLEQQLAHEALHLAAVGLGMLILAIPLLLLFSQSRKNTAAKLSRMNTQLQLDVEIQKNREAELKDAIIDLERFNAVTAGRESRIIELKSEVNELLRQQNKSTRYNIDQTD
jgi:hypothetical protein